MTARFHHPRVHPDPVKRHIHHAVFISLSTSHVIFGFQCISLHYFPNDICQPDGFSDLLYLGPLGYQKTELSSDRPVYSGRWTQNPLEKSRNPHNGWCVDAGGHFDFNNPVGQSEKRLYLGGIGGDGWLWSHRIHGRLSHAGQETEHGPECSKQVSTSNINRSISRCVSLSVS